MPSYGDLTTISPITISTFKLFGFHIVGEIVVKSQYKCLAAGRRRRDHGHRGHARWPGKGGRRRAQRSGRGRCLRGRRPAADSGRRLAGGRRDRRGPEGSGGARSINGRRPGWRGGRPGAAAGRRRPGHGGGADGTRLENENIKMLYFMNSFTMSHFKHDHFVVCQTMLLLFSLAVCLNVPCEAPSAAAWPPSRRARARPARASGSTSRPGT